MKKVRIGVLSTAKIGVNLVIPAMQKSSYCEISGIASRNIDNARNTADLLGIQKAYGSYEDLLKDPDIDAVYNPLPNHLHVEWTLKALDAGKHVLCEKPIGMSLSDAEKLSDVSTTYPDLKLSEAFMYRFHPRWVEVKKLVDDGVIGQLRIVQSLFSYYNTDPTDIRNMADIGGGGLLDIGCYCISAARFLFGREPVHVTGSVDIDPKFQTDRIASGVLDFDKGISVFSCSTQTFPQQYVRIYGSEGYIVIDGNAFTPGPDDSAPLRIYTDSSEEIMDFEPCDHYTLQGDAFALSILNNSDSPNTMDDAIANMRVIEQIFHSAQHN